MDQTIDQRSVQDLAGLDRIRLTGISGYGYHGVYAHERQAGQRFVVDVELFADLQPAARSDDLASTVDYATLASAIVADVQGEPLNLLESLARRIGRTCLRPTPVQQVTVTVHKPDVLMPVAVADVAVTLTTIKERT